MSLSHLKTSNGTSSSDVSLSVSKHSLSVLLRDDDVDVSVGGDSVTRTRLRLFGGSLLWVAGRLSRGFKGQRPWLVCE